ncbi:MAG: hypothetical protein ACE5NC_12360, partial [Anaerolineae bacterium]
MSGKEAVLRGLIRHSLAARARLVESDALIHGLVEEPLQRGFLAGLSQSLSAVPLLTEDDRLALVAMASREAGEFRSVIQAHLDGQAAVPHEDLAIYVPGEGTAPGQFERDLLERLRKAPPAGDKESGISPRDPFGRPADPDGSVEVSVPGRDAVAAQGPDPLKRLPKTTRDPIAPLSVLLQEEKVPGESSTDDEDTAEAPVSARVLNPLLFLTAALGAIGLGREEFGFLLQYGRYAPKGRLSQI